MHLPQTMVWSMAIVMAIEELDVISVGLGSASGMTRSFQLILSFEVLGDLIS